MSVATESEGKPIQVSVVDFYLLLRESRTRESRGSRVDAIVLVSIVSPRYGTMKSDLP